MLISCRYHTKIFSALNWISICSIEMTIRSRMRWAWHVTRIGEKGNAYRILLGKPKGRDH
jgi:hypothetical protein